MIWRTEWSTLSASMCMTPNWGEPWIHWRKGLLLRQGHVGEMGWAELHEIQKEKVWGLASVKESHAIVQAARMPFCRKMVKYCNKFSSKVTESLSSEVFKTQLDMALSNLIYLDLFWACSWTRYPLKVLSTPNFDSMTIYYLLCSAPCMHEDFEECSISKIYINLGNYYVQIYRMATVMSFFFLFCELENSVPTMKKDCFIDFSSRLVTQTYFITSLFSH